MDKAPSVFIDQASLCFGGRTVFHDCSLTLQAGQWTGLLGESGIGKTSLLRLVAGLALEPGLAGTTSSTSPIKTSPSKTSLSETSSGVKSTGLQASLRTSDDQPLSNRVAYMAQQDLLLPWATVLENVMIGAKLRTPWFGFGRKRAEQNEGESRARGLIDKVGLTAHIDQKPGALSGGMRQRVALARTLFEERPIVLMDEPFSALDALTRRHLQALARDLLACKTVLLVTHDPMEAVRLCDHIHVMGDHPVTVSAALSPGASSSGTMPREESQVQGDYYTLLALLGVTETSAPQTSAPQTSAPQASALGKTVLGTQPSLQDAILRANVS